MCESSPFSSNRVHCSLYNICLSVCEICPLSPHSLRTLNTELRHKHSVNHLDFSRTTQQDGNKVHLCAQVSANTKTTKYTFVHKLLLQSDFCVYRSTSKQILDDLCQSLNHDSTYKRLRQTYCVQYMHCALQTKISRQIPRRTACGYR